MVPLEEQMGREQGTDKIEGGAFSGVNEFNIIEYSVGSFYFWLLVDPLPYNGSSPISLVWGLGGHVQSFFGLGQQLK